MQDGDRLSSQTIGNVLDRPGSQRHPGAALLPSQWTLRGLLGGAPRGPGGLTSTSMSPAPSHDAHPMDAPEPGGEVRTDLLQLLRGGFGGMVAYVFEGFV